MKRTIVLTALALFAPARAFAADEFERARATGLFAEAQALAEAGKHKEACAKFQESVELHAGVDNRYHLADCWERIGRTASAYAMFLEVVANSRELQQSEREKAATERADSLATKLTRLRVDVRAPTKDLELTKNGRPIARADWGRPIPVDPGAIELRVAAPGKKTWLENLTLPTEPVTVLVMVPPLEEAGRAPAVNDEASTRAENESSGNFRSYATIGLLGVGAAGIVVGSVMGVRYAADNADAKDVCPASIGCTEREIALHEELVEDARTARTWAYLGFGVGASALTGAALLHFTRPSKKERADAPELRARVFVTGDGVTGTLLGRF